MPEFKVAGRAHAEHQQRCAGTAGALARSHRIHAANLREKLIGRWVLSGQVRAVTIVGPLRPRRVEGDSS
jgi:hypothetical protein